MDRSFCDELKFERHRQICRGESELPTEHENRYLASWGLEPIPQPMNVATLETDHKKIHHKGLGDTVAAFTAATGIDRAVKFLTGDRGCGCKARQEALNQMFPYKEWM